MNKKVALFSLEMSDLQILNRLMIDLTDIGELGKQILDNTQVSILNRQISEICYKDLYIDDTPNISISSLKTKARILKAKHKIDLIIIDYLQLMNDKSGSHGNRELEISAICRTLKSLAKELEIPIIALSQLNRSLEMRSDKRPNLSDLRESGAIEQDSDIVIFVHRPEKFGIFETPDGKNLKGLAEIIIAKHRNGAIGEIFLNFDASKMRFTDEIENLFEL